MRRRAARTICLIAAASAVAVPGVAHALAQTASGKVSTVSPAYYFTEHPPSGPPKSCEVHYFGVDTSTGTINVAVGGVLVVDPSNPTGPLLETAQVKADAQALTAAAADASSGIPTVVNVTYDDAETDLCGTSVANLVSGMTVTTPPSTPTLAPTPTPAPTLAPLTSRPTPTPTTRTPVPTPAPAPAPALNTTAGRVTRVALPTAITGGGATCKLWTATLRPASGQPVTLQLETQLTGSPPRPVSKVAASQVKRLRTAKRRGARAVATVTYASSIDVCGRTITNVVKHVSVKTRRKRR